MTDYLENIQYICRINHTKWLSVIWWSSLILSLLLHPLALLHLLHNVDGHLGALNIQKGLKGVEKRRSGSIMKCIKKYSKFDPTD